MLCLASDRYVFVKDRGFTLISGAVANRAPLCSWAEPSCLVSESTQDARYRATYAEVEAKRTFPYSSLP